MAQNKRVTIEGVGAAMRDEAATIARLITRVATLRAALKGMSVVVRATPSDRGIARGAWDVEQTSDGALLYNDAPHAGVLEFGARPHKPPLLPILRWVVRKFGLNLRKRGKRSFESIKEVPWTTYLVAKSIQENIAKNGAQPNYMVGNNLPTLNKYLADETKRVIRNWERMKGDKR